MSKQKIKEKILLFKVKNNQDREAFGRIYDIYIDSIYRYIFFKTGSKEEAEDLSSEVFLKIWDYLTVESKNRPSISDFRPFAYKVARNCIVDYYREKNKMQETVSIEDQDRFREIPDEQKDLFSKILAKSEKEELSHLLNKLKADYREVIILRYVEDLKINDIASVIGRTKGATRVLLHRAVNTLKDLHKKNKDE